MTSVPSGDRCMWVLDPLTRKLLVPMKYLVQTQATQTPGTVPSLCIAFLENRCHHAWCRQAHVLPHMIHKLRHDALHAPTCCVSHGDPHDLSCLTARFSTVTIVDSCNAEPFPTSSVALTVGLQRHLAQSVPAKVDGGNLELSSRLICRLHLAQRCRYLEDCNNIHVCRRLDLRLHPPPHMVAPLTALVPNATSVCIGDTQYSVLFIAGPEASEDSFKKLLRHRRLKDMRKHRRIVGRVERQQMRRSAPAMRSTSPASESASSIPPDESWELGSQESSMSSSPFSTSLSSESERSDDEVIYLYEKFLDPVDGGTGDGSRKGQGSTDMGDSFTVQGEDPKSATSSPPQRVFQHPTAAAMMMDASRGNSTVPSIQGTPIFAPHTHDGGGGGVSPLHTFQTSPPLYANDPPPMNGSMTNDPTNSGLSSLLDPYTSGATAVIPTSSSSHNVIPQSLPQPPYTRVYDVRQVSKEKGSPTPFAPRGGSPALSMSNSAFTNSPELTGTLSKHLHGNGTRSNTNQSTPTSTPPYAVPRRAGSECGTGAQAGTSRPPPYSPLSLPSAADDYSLAHEDRETGNPSDSPMQLGEGMQALRRKDSIEPTTTHQPPAKSSYAAAASKSSSTSAAVAPPPLTASHHQYRDPALVGPRFSGKGLSQPAAKGTPIKATTSTTKLPTPAKVPRPHIPASDEGVSVLPDGAGWKVLPFD